MVRMIQTLNYASRSGKSVEHFYRGYVEVHDDIIDADLPIEKIRILEERGYRIMEDEPTASDEGSTPPAPEESVANVDTPSEDEPVEEGETSEEAHDEERGPDDTQDESIEDLVARVVADEPDTDESTTEDEPKPAPSRRSRRKTERK